jgi:hypothetical protein
MAKQYTWTDLDQRSSLLACSKLSKKYSKVKNGICFLTLLEIGGLTFKHLTVIMPLTVSEMSMSSAVFYLRCQHAKYAVSAELVTYKQTVSRQGVLTAM